MEPFVGLFKLTNVQFVNYIWFYIFSSVIFSSTDVFFLTNHSVSTKWLWISIKFESFFFQVVIFFFSPLRLFETSWENNSGSWQSFLFFLTKSVRSCLLNFAFNGFKSSPLKSLKRLKGEKFMRSFTLTKQTQIILFALID